jgi:glucuronide carrier protein
MEASGMTDNTAARGESTRPVVTLFESYGAGADYVGARVAEALDVPFHTQAFSSDEFEGAATAAESEGLLSRVYAAMGGSYAGLDGQRSPHRLRCPFKDRTTFAARPWSWRC